MFAALQVLEAKVKAAVERFDGEAVHVAEEVRDEALAEVAKVKAEVVKVKAIAADFEAAAKAAVAAAEPVVKAEVERLAGKLIADLEAVLGASM